MQWGECVILVHAMGISKEAKWQILYKLHRVRADHDEIGRDIGKRESPLTGNPCNIVIFITSRQYGQSSGVGYYFAHQLRQAAQLTADHKEVVPPTWSLTAESDRL